MPIDPTAPREVTPIVINPGEKKGLDEATGKEAANLFGQGTSLLLKNRKVEVVSTFGQITGAAALAAGSLIYFAGIGATITVAGSPIGLPLMIGGGVLLSLGLTLSFCSKLAEQSWMRASLETLQEGIMNTIVGGAMGSGAAYLLPSLTAAQALGIGSQVLAGFAYLLKPEDKGPQTPVVYIMQNPTQEPLSRDTKQSLPSTKEQINPKQFDSNASLENKQVETKKPDTYPSEKTEIPANELAFAMAKKMFEEWQIRNANPGKKQNKEGSNKTKKP